MLGFLELIGFTEELLLAPYISFVSVATDRSLHAATLGKKQIIPFARYQHFMQFILSGREQQFIYRRLLDHLAQAVGVLYYLIVWFVSPK